MDLKLLVEIFNELASIEYRGPIIITDDQPAQGIAKGAGLFMPPIDVAFTGAPFRCSVAARAAFLTNMIMEALNTSHLQPHNLSLSHKVSPWSLYEFPNASATFQHVRHLALHTGYRSNWCRAKHRIHGFVNDVASIPHLEELPIDFSNGSKTWDKRHPDHEFIDRLCAEAIPTLKKLQLTGTCLNFDALLGFIWRNNAFKCISLQRNIIHSLPRSHHILLQSSSMNAIVDAVLKRQTHLDEVTVSDNSQRLLSFGW